MAEYTVELMNQKITIQTGGDVFSPGALDRGTAAMLSRVSFSPEDKVLDLGCGCGIVGILAARIIGADRVTMCDISKDALFWAEKNAAANEVLPGVTLLRSDGLAAINDRDYTMILSNPPYHTDFSVAKGFIEEGFSHLRTGGKLYMVTKRRDWYKNKLISVFGGVKIDEIDGYYVVTAEKRPFRQKKESSDTKALPNSNSNTGLKPTAGLSKKLARKMQKKQHSSFKL